MPHRLLIRLVFLCVFSLGSGTASALTLGQLAAVCDSQPGPCHELPLAQAYVGGALDLVAVLDEQTDYLRPLYCVPPEALFDVPAIIDFMLERRGVYAKKNAMLLVVAYLEEKGGCTPGNQGRSD